MPSEMIPNRIRQIIDIITNLNSNGAGFSDKIGNGTGILDNGGNDGVGNGNSNGRTNTNEKKKSGNYEKDNGGIAKLVIKLMGTGDLDFGQTHVNSNSAAPGISSEVLSSSLSSSEAGKSSAFSASPKAYEINKTTDILSIISADNVNLRILAVIIVLIFLLVGYKRQSYK